MVRLVGRNDLLSPKAASEFCGLSVRTLTHLAVSGKLAFERVKGSPMRRFRRADLARLLERTEATG